MNNLQELLSLCKYGIQIYVNSYKNAYQSVYEGIDIIDEKLPIKIKNAMIKTENIINIDCYPFTPISSLSVYHYDINDAIEEAIKEIKEWQKERQND